MKTKINLFLFVSLFTLNVFSSPWNGTTKTIWNSVAGVNDGTSIDKPFLITSSENLAKLAEMVNAGTSYSGQFFKLTANLDLGNQNWTCIGDVNSFSGTFDGNWHSISNLSITKWSNNIGLFGKLNSATIKNLGIESGSIMCGGSNGGAIAGSSTGTASNLTYISNCYNKATIVYGSTDPRVYIGGIIGVMFDNSWVDHCYNWGNVTNNGSTLSNYTGGIAGAVASASTLYSCYSTGIIIGFGTVGGVVGANWSATVNCYYDAVVCTGTNAAIQAMGSNPNTSDVTGMTTANMKADPFVTTLNAGTSLWKSNQGNYPILTGSGTTATNNASQSKLKIIVQRRNIIIDNATMGENLIISDIVGKVIYNGNINATTVSIRIPNVGIYIVKAGLITRKIQVK